MNRKLWKEIMVAVLLVSTILSFTPIAYGETISAQQSIDSIKMEMKKAAMSYVDPALKGELVSSASLYSVLNNVKKNYQTTRNVILTSNLTEKEKQAKLKELDALYEEKIVKGLIPYIDAYNYATKYLDPLLKEIKEAEVKNDFLAVEKAYHKLSVQLKSRTSILYRFTGKAPRDLLLEKYKKPADAKRDEMMVPVTIIMKLTNVQQLYQAGKIEEAMKVLEDIPSLVAKLSRTNAFHQSLIKEMEGLQGIVFPAPVTPVVPTPPVTPPSTGGSGDSGGSSETSAQRALRLAKINSNKELANYKGDVKGSYSSTNWDAISNLKTKWTSTINVAKTTAAVTQALVDAKNEIDTVKTLVEEQQDLVNAEATKIPSTFAATNLVGTVSLPTVGADYTISVKSTSNDTSYDLSGKVLVDGTSEVVYTVTHTASGKTADTGLVMVTTIIIILKVPPVLNASVEGQGNYIPNYVFTFIDNLDWRNKITSIKAISSSNYTFDFLSGNHHIMSEGELRTQDVKFGGDTWVLMVQAIGYEDSFVTIVLE